MTNLTNDMQVFLRMADEKKELEKIVNKLFDLEGDAVFLDAELSETLAAERRRLNTRIGELKSKLAEMRPTFTRAEMNTMWKAAKR